MPGQPSGRPQAAIRPALPTDVEGITSVINHYVEHSPANFKTLPLTGSEGEEWFSRFATTGRFRLLVAEDAAGGIAGFACTQPYPICRAAYDTSVMATVYLAPDATGHGLGSRLYSALFASVAAEDIHRLFAGITLPNKASVALHRKFGFTEVGVFTEAGRKFDQYWDVLWMERPLAPGRGR